MRSTATLVLLLAWGCAATRPRPSPGESPPPFVGASDRAPENPAVAAGPPEPAIAPTVVGHSGYRDPLIWVNRGVFAFNDVLYRFLLIPLARGYNNLPAALRRGIGNFFSNLQTPVYLLNHLLSLRGAAAGRTLGRFLVNSAAGIGGLFDPAAKWIGWEREPAHLHQTLAGYGVGYGFFLVLPLLGPSDLRSGVSLGAEFFLSPVPYVLDAPESNAVGALGPFQEFAPRAESYQTLRAKSKDPYIFFRNLHLQGIRRDAEH